MSQQPAAWDIFHVWVEKVDRDGKYKYVVIVGRVGSTFGILFINSDEIRNVDLAVCDVRILQVHHPFMTKPESYVTVAGLNATGNLCYLPASLFTEDARRGVIATSYRPSITHAVHTCPTLTPKTLRFIVQCLCV